MKKVSFIVMAFLFFAGCSPFRDLRNTGVVANYEIDRPREANTGAVMFSINNNGNRYLLFEPRFIQSSPLGELTPGQEWVAYSALKSDDRKYLVTSKQFDDEDTGIIINQNGEVTDKLPILKGIRKIFIISLFRVISGNQDKRMPFDNLTDPKLFVRKGTVVESWGDFTAELIYSGVSNKIITLAYREFYKDMARQAFYQEVKYDLNDTDVIVFRTIKMKILEANNSKIAFQVLEDGGLSWIPR